MMASPFRVLPSCCSAEEAWGAAMVPRETPVQGCQTSILPSDRPAANTACSAWRRHTGFEHSKVKHSSFMAWAEALPVSYESPA